MTRTYGSDEWHEDLKSILSKTAGTDVHGVFLFTDTQVRVVRLLLLSEVSIL